MSEWYRVIERDIDIDPENKEVDVWIMKNYSGNVYITMTFNQIKSLYDKIRAIENGT